MTTSGKPRYLFCIRGDEGTLSNQHVAFAIINAKHNLVCSDRRLSTFLLIGQREAYATLSTSPLFVARTITAGITDWEKSIQHWIVVLHPRLILPNWALLRLRREGHA